MHCAEGIIFKILTETKTIHSFSAALIFLH